MPRRTVDEMTVPTLNRIVRDIKENVCKPALSELVALGASVERSKTGVLIWHSLIGIMGSSEEF